MDPRLLSLISEYQQAVAERFEQLRTELHIESPKSDYAWTAFGIASRGRLSDGAEYFKHGFGCSIKYSGGAVNFDFGRNGEIDGFNASRLWGFAEASNRTYGFSSFKEVDATLKKAAAEGSLRFSGYVLYYLNAPKT
jgi:hypothetical protein